MAFFEKIAKIELYIKQYKQWGFIPILAKDCLFKRKRYYTCNCKLLKPPP